MKCAKKPKFGQNEAKILGTLYEALSTFYCFQQH